jgi:hypothetical protein
MNWFERDVESTAIMPGEIALRFMHALCGRAAGLTTLRAYCMTGADRAYENGMGSISETIHAML